MSVPYGCGIFYYTSMTSFLEELQQDILNPEIKVSNLLRKALILSKKLKIKEFEEWVSLELKGYSTGKVPLYRNVFGEFRVMDTAGEIHHIHIDQDFIKESISKIPETSGLPEVEVKISNNILKKTIETTYPTALNTLIKKTFLPHLDGFTPLLSFQISELQKIGESVKTILQDWIFKIEEQNIKGDGLSFTKKEIANAKNISTKEKNFADTFLGKIMISIVVGLILSGCTYFIGWEKIQTLVTSLLP